MKRPDVYLRHGLRKVEGWLDPLSARIVERLSSVQREKKAHGPSVEIGVHHGKFFILLHLLSPENSRDVAIDVFERQELNVDASGRGDLPRFEANLRKWSDQPESVRIVAESSLNLQADQIVDGADRALLFSIDGGHTAECVRNDLKLAQDSLHDLGVVILDDYFNAYWPEVSQGTAEFMTSDACGLEWFAIAPNKVYLCQRGQGDVFRDELRRRMNPGFFEKSTQTFGSTVDVYGIRRSMPGVFRQLKFRLLETGWGRKLRDRVRLRRGM